LIAQTKSHYEFCVDNDDSCICDQAKDGDKLYVPATPATLTIDEGINALADCMGIASVTYGDAGMKWIKDELHVILTKVAASAFNDGKADAIEDMAMTVLKRKR